MHTIKSGLVASDALQKTIGIRNGSPNTTLKDIESFWWTIANGFSYCNLTRQEDKLVAISGLTKKNEERRRRLTSLPEC
jgi:hypothetical protein